MKRIANIPVKEIRAEGKPKRPSKSKRKPVDGNAADSKIPASDNPSELGGEISAAGKTPLTNQDAQNLITNQGETLNQNDKIEN
ncbi:MAG: hypothetical protein ABIR06_09925 [Cyclobacteriaceae bacterium]